MFGFISKRLFGKVFILIFLAIFMVLFLFTTGATRLQKESIISSLESESKTMADAMTLLNKENLIIDNKIGIFEFLNEYVKLNKQIESVIISRNENAYNIIIKKERGDVSSIFASISLCSCASLFSELLLAMLSITE